MQDQHETLTEALTLAGERGDIGWVNDAGVLVIFDPAVGDIDFVPCTFAVLMQVNADGTVPQLWVFTLDEQRRCVCKIADDKPIARRVRRHVELIYECMSEAARERHRAAFASEFLQAGDRCGSGDGDPIDLPSR